MWLRRGKTFLVTYLPLSILFLFIMRSFHFNVPMTQNPRAIVTPEQFTLNDAGMICHNDGASEPSISMRGSYRVLYNYFKAEKVFNCNESITYTTHGEAQYLMDNLEAEDWHEGGVITSSACYIAH